MYVTINYILIWIGVVFFGSVVGFTDLRSREIKWVDVSQSEAVLMRQDPCGIENTLYLYLCRVTVNGAHYSGKLVFDHLHHTCFFTHNGTASNNKNFQMLDAPPGTTSWVPLKVAFPNDAVVVSNEDNRKTWACRAKLGDLLIIGTLDNDGVCRVELGGEEHKVTGCCDIEMLAINLYGRRLGAKQVF